MKMRKIHSLFGAKLLFLFFLAIVFGVAAGFIEIAFGFSLQNFLVAYHLLEPANSPFSVPIKISPVVLLILLAIIQAGFTLVNALIPYLCLEGFNKRIRYFLSHNSLGADRENNYTLTMSEVSHILTNLTPNVAIFIGALVQFVIALIIGITIFTAMAKISLSLTLISLVILAVLNVPLLLLKNIIQRHSAKIYNYRNEFLKKILKGLKNIYFLRIVGANRQELQELLSLNINIFSSYLRYIISILFNSTLPLFTGVVVIVTIVFANAHYNFAPVSLTVPLVYFLVRLSQNISRSGVCIGQLQFSIPFVREFWNNPRYYERQTEHDEKSGNQKKIIPVELQVKDLSVGRTSSLVKNISFHVKQGDFLYISGKSGKGKTTLLMTLIGIVPSLKGEILWNNTPIHDVDIASLKQCCGYSGTDAFLLDDTIENNLLYGCSNKKEAAKNIPKALEIVHCSFVNDFEHKLQHVLKDSGDGISMGQKQRLSIARALLRSPEVLLLDEGTSNIDEPTEKSIFESIKAHFPSIIIIAVSHRKSIEQFATQVIDI